MSPVVGWLVVAGAVVLVFVPFAIWDVVRFIQGRLLLRRVRAARPGCIAYIVRPVPATQADLDRLTDGRELKGRMVLSAEPTGIELWTRDAAEPVMRLAWSSVESTGMGSYVTQTEPRLWMASKSYPGTTIAFNLAGGGAVHFEAPRGPRLPLDVLEHLESTREDPAGRRMLED